MKAHELPPGKHRVTIDIEVQEDAFGNWAVCMDALGRPNSIQWAEVVDSRPLIPEPPVGSVAVDQDGDVLMRFEEGWGYIILDGRKVEGSRSYTWERLTEDDPNGAATPVTVVHTAGNELVKA